MSKDRHNKSAREYYARNRAKILAGLGSPEGRRNPFGISIDRIDSNLGYTRENTRLVCNIVNMAMQDWGEEPLLKLAKLLVK